MPTGKPEARSSSPTMSLEELDFLKNKRKYIRTKVTRKCTNVNSNLNNFSRQELREEVADLQDLRLKLDLANENVSRGLWIYEKDKGVLDKELEDCDAYDSKLIAAVRLLEGRLQGTTSASGHEQVSEINRVSNQLKLPQLPLPTYSHAKGENLGRFFTKFENIMNKYTLSNYEKFVFLEKQVSGEALTLIQSLEEANQSYDAAKDLLTKAFASPLTQKYEIIERLSNLKLKDGGDPYAFISEMRVIMDVFKTMQIDSEMILQYFIWSGMNESMKQQFITITNNNKPSLQDITTHIFDATERYQARHPVRASVEPVASLAVDVGSRPKPVKQAPTTTYNNCILCSKHGKESSHPMFKCLMFASPESKLAELSSMNACIKCANPSHKSSSCRFKFKRSCKHCAGQHFSFLCVKRKECTPGAKIASGQSASQSSAKPNEKTSCAAVVHSQVMQLQFGDAVILPTFSALLSNGREIRGLKDSGCQTSFISRNVADREKLTVLKENFALTINGFNSSKRVETNLVEVKILFGSRLHALEAVVLPELPISLSLPELPTVVHNFVDKGYTLADNFLIGGGDQISNIDLILGADASHCLPCKTVTYGQHSKSVYLDSACGVLLIGSIDQHLRNSDELPMFHGDHSSAALTSSRQVTTPADIFAAETSCGIPEGSILKFNLCTRKESLNKDTIETELETLTPQALDVLCSEVLESADIPDVESGELNNALVEKILSNCTRDDSGRITMPILWNDQVAHLLGHNLKLAQQILGSNLKKLQKNNTLFMVNDTIKEQERLGIIERVNDVNALLKENPSVSFLAHMPVFRPDKDSTKCRVVYLSNLCEQSHGGPLALNHNQCMFAGPCLNRKIATSLLLLRFDEKLLCFDLIKAFLQIALAPDDQNKLCFLWYADAEHDDFSVVAYKCKRLPFGLKCSPTLLMLALYKILILDSANDDDALRDMKRRIYDLMYMDNGAISCNSSAELNKMLEVIPSIFSPYGFTLQQFTSNDPGVQEIVDEKSQIQTPVTVNMLGLQWNRSTDSITASKLQLDAAATTKRQILSSIASNFDLFNFNGPLLNRARLFMHALQCNTVLSWDSKLNIDMLREWVNIAKQINATPQISISRFVGKRDDTYELVAFTDSSKDLIGVVLFLRSVTTNKTSFVLAKNRIISKKLDQKTVPCLELQAITLGTETLVDAFEELAGQTCVVPIKISALKLYSDSLVCLSWLNLHVNKLDSLKKRSIFVKNRLAQISKLCSRHAVEFLFCAGAENPADCITRALSYQQLSKSNYFRGPNLEAIDLANEMPKIIVPHPLITPALSTGETAVTQLTVTGDSCSEPLLAVDSGSSFKALVNTMKLVLKFADKLKAALIARDSVKFKHLKTRTSAELSVAAHRYIIMTDQRKHFPEVFAYFSSKNKTPRSMPNVVSQLNVFKDEHGLLRVRSKFKRWISSYNFPLLLSKNSALPEKIIRDVHKRLNHAGLYTVLSEVRREFWIPHSFSAVKRTLKTCINCRKVNSRTLKLNQSPYRDFRVDPPNVPFRYIFIDYFGPYRVKVAGIPSKVYVLCITCLWSRAINLKISLDLSTHNFLRAFQLHTFEFGVPELCLSDLGTQIVAGANLISELINDPVTLSYFQEHDVKPLKFQQYFKGCNELGGLVESCVKMTKRLIHGAIGKAVLNYSDFEFVICHAVHLVNRRPIAFKEALRENNPCADIPAPITPEILLKGHELTSLNLIPGLRAASSVDPDWSSDPVARAEMAFNQLSGVRARLVQLYNEEFLANLAHQATSVSNRYKPINHEPLRKGDIVLLKETLTKPVNYPMGIVLDVVMNEMGESTDAVVRKGATRETVKRHSTSLIPLLRRSKAISTANDISMRNNSLANARTKSTRKAAQVSKERTKQLIAHSLV